MFGKGLLSCIVHLLTSRKSMTTRFSPFSRLSIKKVGDVRLEGPLKMRFRTSSCSSHFRTVSLSSALSGYTLQLITFGASGWNLIVMSSDRLGGKRLDASSEKTRSCLLYFSGIVSKVSLTSLSCLWAHCCAKFVHLMYMASSFLGYPTALIA